MKKTGRVDPSMTLIQIQIHIKWWNEWIKW